MVVPRRAVSKVTIAPLIDACRTLQSGGNIWPTMRARLWKLVKNSVRFASVLTHACQ
jgi:hypothetical protein